MKENFPKIKGVINLKESESKKINLYKIYWPFVNEENLKFEIAPPILDSKNILSNNTILFRSPNPANNINNNPKSDLFYYYYNPHLLVKKRIPLIIQPKIIELDNFTMNVRILLNPKYKQFLDRIDMTFVTLIKPSIKDRLTNESNILEDGFVIRIFSKNFDEHFSWTSKFELDNKNKITDIHVLGYFTTTIFPQTLPQIFIQTESGTKDDFSEIQKKTKMIFDFKRKLIN